MGKKIGKAPTERKKNIQQLFRELINHIPSLMTQIHLCMLHGYKNSKLQISTRGLCKKKCRKSRESKEEFIRRLYFSGDTKRRLECIVLDTFKKQIFLLIFFNVLRMKKSEFKWNNLLQVKIKQFLENMLTVCACSESYHKAKKGCFSDHFQTCAGCGEQNADQSRLPRSYPHFKRSVRKPISSLNLEKRNCLFSDLTMKIF